MCVNVGLHLCPDAWARDFQHHSQEHDRACKQVVARASPLKLEPVQGGATRVDLLVEDVRGRLHEATLKFGTISQVARPEHGDGLRLLHSLNTSFKMIE